MKNKKVIYLLLGVVALVWGWIFVSLFKVYSEESTALPASLDFKKSIALTAVAKDSFALLTNYPDPFFKGISHYTKRHAGYGEGTSDRAPSRGTSSVAVKQDWSFIQYKGTIKRKTTGKLLSLVTVSGRDYSLAVGEKAENISIVKNCKDSLLISYEGKKKYIKRN